MSEELHPYAPSDPRVRRARGILMQAGRRYDFKGHTPEEVQEARRFLAEAKIANYVRKVVDAAPPLGAEAAGRIAALLLSKPEGGDAR